MIDIKGLGAGEERMIVRPMTSSGSSGRYVISQHWQGRGKPVSYAMSPS